ncbi:MAG: phosphatidylserine decarboxylase [Bacteroidales bacterium]|nr:phosphatidylserine decarboxylase [Bacteroidales bacterium]
MIRIDKNSKGTVAAVCIFCVAVTAAVFAFVPSWWIRVPVLLLMAWFCRWQILFHSVPRRNPVSSDTDIVAVSDGRIVICDEVEEKVYLNRRVKMISIYMDFWDYHVNWWPVNGTVERTQYFPGKHALAFKPKASEENEHTCTVVKAASGAEVLFKQLAGGFARRIVCYAKPGLEVRGGEQCGIIKFGSRIDIFLPLAAEVLVKVGDVVTGSETILARL